MTLAATACYSAVHGFRLAEELAELADGPTGRGEVARGVYLLGTSMVTSSTVLLRWWREGLHLT